MSAGLQVRDQNGGIILDTQRMFLGLVKSGPLQWFKGYDTGSWDDFGISFEAVAPVVFISGGATPITINRSGNWWTFYYRPIETLSTGSGYDPLGRPPGMGWWPEEVRAYVFDFMKPNKRRVGLEVRHPDGRIAFNSDQHPMNVVLRINPPAVHTASNHRPPYTDTWGWLTDTSFPFGYQASTNLTNWGLTSGRTYAWNQPWTRGAKGYGGGDNRGLFEAAILYGDMLGLTWQLDPFFDPQFAGDEYQPVYDTYETVSTYTIVDVTGLPYPMDY